MKNVILPGALLFALLLLFSPVSYSQTPKQIKEAFTGSKRAKTVVFYCKDRKQYNKKVKRLLRIMDRKKIFCSFKVKYKYSKTNYFKFDYKSYYYEQDHKRTN